MKRMVAFVFVIIFSLSLWGCAPRQEESPAADVGGRVVCTSVISPNEAYAASEADKVICEVEVRQKKDGTIWVEAQANTPFFEGMQYQIAYDKPISEEDVSIQWTTLMGNPEGTEEDQLGIATVTVRDGEAVISERKINFIKKAMEVIVDAVGQKKG